MNTATATNDPAKESVFLMEEGRRTNAEDLSVRSFDRNSDDLDFVTESTKAVFDQNPDRFNAKEDIKVLEEEEITSLADEYLKKGIRIGGETTTAVTADKTLITPSPTNYAESPMKEARTSKELEGNDLMGVTLRDMEVLTISFPMENL